MAEGQPAVVRPRPDEAGASFHGVRPAEIAATDFAKATSVKKERKEHKKGIQEANQKFSLSSLCSFAAIPFFLVPFNGPSRYA